MILPGRGGTASQHVDAVRMLSLAEVLAVGSQ